MKKSQSPWAGAQAEYETRIRADERGRALGDHYHKLEQALATLDKLRSQITAMISGRDPADEPPPMNAMLRRQRPGSPIPLGHQVEALAILDKMRPVGTPLTPTQIAKTWDKEYGGRRKASLACEALVAKGLAEKLGRKGFRAIQKEVVRGQSDGSDEAKA